MSKSKYRLDDVYVLIVEDDLGTRAIVREVLRTFQVADIQSAVDGQDGLEKLEIFEADVIVCDWNMPGMDGLEFCRRVREHPDPRIQFTPLIMLTGNRTAEDVKEARDAGVNEFLGKPFAAEDLYKRISAVLSQPRPVIRTHSYFGPSRRRTRLDPGRPTPKRRQDDD